MPHSTEWSERGVRWTFRGVVTGEELIAANEAVYADERFSDIRYQIVDLLAVERFDVTAADMRRLAQTDHAAARSNPSMRVAVAAESEIVRQMSLYYEAESSDSPWDQQVFDDLAVAEAWARS